MSQEFRNRFIPHPSRFQLSFPGSVGGLVVSESRRKIFPRIWYDYQSLKSPVKWVGRGR